MYDDPPEPTEDEITEARVSQSATVRIEGLTRADVYAVISGTLERNYDMTQRMREAIDEAVKARVSKLMTEAIKERIEKAVDAAIADGFPIFDSYTGKETGRTSVSEVVHKKLTEKEGGYRDRTTLAEAAVKKAVTALFDRTEILAARGPSLDAPLRPRSAAPGADPSRAPPPDRSGSAPLTTKGPAS